MNEALERGSAEGTRGFRARAFAIRAIALGGGFGVLIGALGASVFVLAPERYLIHGLNWLALEAVLQWSARGLVVGLTAGVASALPIAVTRRRDGDPARSAWTQAAVLAALVPIAFLASLDFGGSSAWTARGLAPWLGLVPAAGLAAAVLVLASRRTGKPAAWSAGVAALFLTAIFGALLLRPRPVGPNLLFISIDTLRADRLGCYGYRRARTPNLDAIARDGTLWETVIASAPVTLPAMSTVMTGLDPAQHGVHYNGFYALGREAVTLAEVLANRGYATSAVVGNFALDRRFGIEQGFDAFDDTMTRRMSPGPPPSIDDQENATWWQRHLSTQPAQRFANEVTRAGLNWLEQNADEAPFLLWLHYMDPHGPFLPPAQFERSDPYDGEVSFVDDEIGALLTGYREVFPDADTLLVVVADHGESLGEHGVNGHVFAVYEQTLRVPFLMMWPGKIEPGRRVAEPLRGRDVPGEILRALEIDDLPVAFRRAPAYDPETWWAYSESYQPVIAGRGEPLRSLRGERWKLIQRENGESELFDLSTDPGEVENLAARQTDRTKELLAILERAAGTTEHASLDVDDATMDRLRELGYVE